MTVKTYVYSTTLVVTSCWCGIGHAIPKDLYEAAEKDHKKGIYCPLGHSWVFAGETDAQKLTRQLRAEQDYATQLNERLTTTQNSLSATKGVVTRMRNRAVAGECSFCGQHLRDLARHVSRMHADEKAEL